MPYVPHHWINEESGSLLDLKVGYKCIFINLEIKELGKCNLVCNANEKTSKAKVQIKRWND
jgi:hypothetical protein